MRPYPTTEAQEARNAFTDSLLRERDAYEDAREEREEQARTAMSLRPHKFQEYPDIPGFCRCGLNKTGEIHT